jgi:hypothetical protein
MINIPAAARRELNTNEDWRALGNRAGAYGGGLPIIGKPGGYSPKME